MRLPSLFIAVLVLAGCSKTATIYMIDGSVHEAEIVGGSKRSIFLKGVQELVRDEIIVIDHPGNVEAIIGTIGFAVLTPVTIIGYIEHSTCSEWECLGTLAIIISGLSGAITSTVFAIWGWYTWGISNIAASQTDGTVKPYIAPVALTDGERTYWGLGMSWRW